MKYIIEIISLFYCFFYGISSFCFSLGIKYFYRKYPQNLTFSLLLCENMINVLICLILGKKNHTSKQTLLYSCISSLQTFTGLKGLQMMSIPLYMTLRRTLILFVFIIQGIGTVSQFLPIVFITCGAIIAGSEHLEDNTIGYILIFSNNILNAISLLWAKKLNKDKQMDPLELVFQNSCNQIPFLFIGAYLDGEFHQITDLYDDQLLLWSSGIGLLGFFLSYSTNLCNMRNSPIAIAITHNVKDIVITTVSIIMFSDFKYDQQIILGIAISYFGSILFSVYKIKEIQTQKMDKQI